MEKTARPIPWFSGGLAALVALLILAITLPNTGKVVVDHSVSPPRVYTQPLPVVVWPLLSLTVLSVLCIVIPGRRWIFFDWLGWFILAVLLVGAFMR